MITVSGTNEILSWPKKNGKHVCPLYRGLRKDADKAEDADF